jgi:hypothetical protein
VYKAARAKAGAAAVATSAGAAAALRAAAANAAGPAVTGGATRPAGNMIRHDGRIHVLNRDYFTVPEADLCQVRSVLTVPGGQVVHT